jgi:hypothetical protein
MRFQESHPVLSTCFCLSLALALIGAASLAQCSFMAAPRDLEATGYTFFIFLVPSFGLALLVALVTVVRWRHFTKGRRWAGLACLTFAPFAGLVGTVFDALFYGK